MPAFDMSALLWWCMGANLYNIPAMSYPYHTIALVLYRTGTGPADWLIQYRQGVLYT